MIAYAKKPKGGLGNRLFQLNFIGQLGHLLERNYNFYSPGDSKYFMNVSSKHKPFFPRFTQSAIDLSELVAEEFAIIRMKVEEMRSKRLILIEGSYLGETFFDFNFCDPRKIVIPRFQIEKTQSIACHFRGGDFHTWNAQAILPHVYYMQAIEMIDSKLGQKLPIKLITDDSSLEAFEKVSKSLKSRVTIKLDNDPIHDFADLAGSQFIVSSPSTFAIWAGILGGCEGIIHSSKWVQMQCELDDPFWNRLSKGGNPYYKAMALV